jgi:hypothetical protein
LAEPIAALAEQFRLGTPWSDLGWVLMGHRHARILEDTYTSSDYRDGGHAPGSRAELAARKKVQQRNWGQSVTAFGPLAARLLKLCSSRDTETTVMSGCWVQRLQGPVQGQDLGEVLVTLAINDGVVKRNSDGRGMLLDPTKIPPEIDPERQWEPRVRRKYNDSAHNWQCVWIRHKYRYECANHKEHQLCLEHAWKTLIATTAGWRCAGCGEPPVGYHCSCPGEDGHLIIEYDPQANPHRPNMYHCTKCKSFLCSDCYQPKGYNPVPCPECAALKAEGNAERRREKDRNQRQKKKAK